MRVLFAIFPVPAHLYLPVVPLAWALQSAGHEVRFAVQPTMVDAVSNAGITSVPFRENVQTPLDLDTSVDNLQEYTGDWSIATNCRPDEPWQEQWVNVVGMMGMYSPFLDELVELCQQWQPDLVVWDPLCPAASIAARRCGAAHTRLLWGQDNVGWLWQRFSGRSEAESTDMVNYSLKWLMDPMLQPHGMRFEPDMLLGNWTINPMPPRWQVPLDLGVDSLSMRWVPYNGSSGVEDWVRTVPERPRVCLTLGIGGRGRLLFKESGHSLVELVHALAELDIELVVTLKEERDAFAGAVPDNVRIVGFVPLNQLMPTCSAVIHQGGSGTAMAAGTHRVPQLISPMPIWDEETIAQRVVEHGAGLVVRPEDLTPQGMQEQLVRLLEEPQFAEGAAAFHDELQQTSSPNELVPKIEELTACHRA